MVSSFREISRSRESLFEAGGWGSRVLKKERRREKNIGKYRNFSFLIQGERIMPPLPNPKSGNPVPKPSFRRPPSSPPSSCKKIFEFFPAGLEVVAMPKRDASYERLNIKTACVLHFPSSQLFLFFFSLSYQTRSKINSVRESDGFRKFWKFVFESHSPRGEDNEKRIWGISIKAIQL